MIYKSIKYFFIFFVFNIFSFTQAFSQDKWSIEIDDGKKVWVTRNGEITHGDKLRFLFTKNNCDVIQEIFTFYTVANNKNINSLKGKVLGIMINHQQVGAEVLFAFPFLSGHSVWFSLGHYYVEDHIAFWNNTKSYEVAIIDNKNFKADEYFDIQKNIWKMENFTQSLLDGQKKCIRL
tara:strand:+ start:318 stop:851 length:534 start_codon:yes stop_codon:yes gene_type:complete